MNQISHIKINRCIYCGTTTSPLTDEHVIPLSLGGDVILDKASCENCRKITSRCEHNITSNSWAEVRAVTECKSRNRDWNKELFPLNVTFNDDTVGVIKLKKSEILGIAHFPRFSLPGFFDPSEYGGGSRWIGSDVLTFGVDAKKLAEKYNFKKISWTEEYKGHEFELMVVNIGYRIVVASLGLDALSEIFILPTIMENKGDIGFWFGCDTKEEICKNIGRHAMGSHLFVLGSIEVENKKIAYSRIKFFANSYSPEYIVIVGSLK